MNTSPYEGSDRTLLRIWWGLVLVLWAALSIAGVTVSSMGAYASDPAVDSGVIIGEAEPLRTDEYARVTPLMLGIQADGSTEFASPLTNESFIASSVPSAGATVLESLVFPEMGLQYLGPWLPDSVLFAFGFWFLTAVVLLLLPYVLMAWGVRFWVAIGITGLFSVAPVVAWWSLRPFQAILPGVVAAACWVWATRLSGKRARIFGVVGLGVVAGVALARIPWSYPPWSLPLSGAILALTLIYLVRSRADAMRLLFVGVVSAVVAGVVTVGIILANEAAFDALTDSVYPGQRRVAGQLVNLGRSFGAPFNGILQTGPAILTDNATEWSGSWTIAGILWLALAVAGWRASDGAWRIRVALTGVLLAVGYSWFLIDWPVALGEAVPVLNLIPETRMAGIWGLVAILAVAPLLGIRLGWLLLSVTGVATAAVLLVAGMELSDALVPDLTKTAVLAITILTTAVVVLFGLGRAWSIAVAFIVAIPAAALAVHLVNPIQVGLQPLRSSPAALLVLEHAGDRQPESGLWASDTPQFNSLLIANGVPALSGEQWSGASDEWRVLDPDGSYEQQWNRAVSKVSFDWVPGLMQPVILNPYADEIVIQVDPCAPVLGEFNVERVVSATALEGESCLTELGRSVWDRQEFIVYARD